MASVLYNSFKRDIMNGSIDLDTDTINVALVTSAYTADIDTQTVFSNISAEVSATGYTANGATLASVSAYVDTTNNVGIFDAADVTWGTSTITARGAVVYKYAGANSASVSPLVCFVDFGSDKASSAGDFTIQWSNSGLINIA